MTKPKQGRENIQGNHPRPNVFPASGVTTPPPPHPPCEIVCRTEKDWWDKSKPFVEIIGAVLLAVYTGFTILMYCANKIAADAAKSAADTASKALVVANRPWVGLEKVTISDPPAFEDTPQGLRVTIKTVTVAVKNFGSSPALNASFDGGPFDGTEQDPAAQFKRESAMHCGRADLTASYTDKIVGSAGQVIFPGIPATFQVGSNGPAKERTPLVQLIGCISYRDQFGEKLHHTRFCVAGAWNNLSSACPWGQLAD